VTPRRRLLTAVLACCLAMAGCTSRASSTSRLDAVLLTPDDLPGWHKQVLPASFPSILGELVHCTGRRIGKPAETKRSDVLSKGALHVFTVASDYSAFDAVTTHEDVLNSPEADGCMTVELPTIISAVVSGASVSRVQAHVTPGALYAPANLSGTADGRATANTEGHRVPVYVSVQFLAGRKLTLDLVLVSVGRPIDPNLKRPILWALAKRTLNAP
jgi:hypothetical protein